jgi:hypothetical protein
MEGWNIGILEEWEENLEGWNNGILEEWVKEKTLSGELFVFSHYSTISVIPLFQYSIIPFLFFLCPLCG